MCRISTTRVGFQVLRARMFWYLISLKQFKVNYLLSIVVSVGFASGSLVTFDWHVSVRFFSRNASDFSVCLIFFWWFFLKIFYGDATNVSIKPLRYWFFWGCRFKSWRGTKLPNRSQSSWKFTCFQLMLIAQKIASFWSYNKQVNRKI